MKYTFSGQSVLVTGATGNGKSTTIAAIINHIIQQERLHVVTVEDPIEFLFPGGKGLVIQREVGSDTASCSDALRAALPNLRGVPPSVTLAALSAAGCGQKGPLTLPKPLPSSASAASAPAR